MHHISCEEFYGDEPVLSEEDRLWMIMGERQQKSGQIELTHAKLVHVYSVLDKRIKHLSCESLCKPQFGRKPP